MRNFSVFTQSPDGYLWEATGTETLGQTTSTGTVTAPEQHTPTGTTTPSGPTTTTPSGFTYKEDRSTWVDPGKLTAAERATNRAIQEANRWKTQAEENERKVKALAGFETKTPEQRESSEVQAAFYAMFPHMKGLTPEVIEQLLELRNQRQEITEVARNHWDNHTRKTLNQLHSDVAERIGAENLTDRQKRYINAAFLARIPDERAEPEAFQAFKSRYEAGDPKLIEEFLNEYNEDILEPTRRAATKRLIPEPPRVPRYSRGAPVTTSEQRRKPGNLDAAADDIVRVLREGVPR